MAIPGDSRQSRGIGRKMCKPRARGCDSCRKVHALDEKVQVPEDLPGRSWQLVPKNESARDTTGSLRFRSRCLDSNLQLVCGT